MEFGEIDDKAEKEEIGLSDCYTEVTTGVVDDVGPEVGVGGLELLAFGLTLVS